MKITQTQKREIARLVAEKAQALENETIHVWIDSRDNSISLTLGSWEYRDDHHVCVASLDIRNEGHPYSQADILRTLEFKGV